MKRLQTVLLTKTNTISSSINIVLTVLCLKYATHRAKHGCVLCVGKMLANPWPQSYSVMCVIRDTNGSGSEEVWASNRGKHSNQCLGRPSDVQWMEACNYLNTQLTATSSGVSHIYKNISVLVK